MSEKHNKNLARSLGIDALTGAQKIAGAVLCVAVVAFCGITAMGFAKPGTETRPGEVAVRAEKPAYIGNLDFSDRLIDLGVKKAEADRLARTVTVSLKAGSAEEDLEVQIVDEKTGKLIEGVDFSVNVKAKKGSYNKDWKVDDGYLHLTKIDSGEYEVSIAEKEYYIMPEPITVKVQKKVEKVVIDVKDLIKDESEIDASKEDASFGNASQTPSRPPKVTDTVEYVASSSKEVTKTVDVKKYTFTPYGIEDGRLKDKNGNLTKYYAETDSNGNITDIYRYSDTHPASAALSVDSMGILRGNKNISARTLVLTNIDTGYEIMLLEGESESTDSTPPEAPADSTPESSSQGTPPETPTPPSSEVTPPSSSQTPESSSTETSSDSQSSSESSSSTPDSSSDAPSSSDSSSAGSSDSTQSGSSSQTPSSSGSSSESSSQGSSSGSTSSDSASSSDKGEKVTVKFTNEDGSLNSRYADIVKVTETTVKEDVKVTVYYGWQTLDGARYYFDKDGNAVKGTKIIQGVSYFFDSRGRLSTGVTQAIDVSKWNGNINWNKVKESGVTQVIIRVGYRGYGTGALVVDPTFAQNIRGAKARGLKVGLYFFSQAISAAEAVEEASLCVKALRDTGYGLELPIYFDSEYSTSAKTGRADGLSQTLRTEVAKAFCQTIQSAGYRAGIYRSKTWYYYQLNFSRISQYSIWVAHYTSQTDFKYHYDIWQYTGSGSCPGVNTAVDKNYVYRSF